GIKIYVKAVKEKFQPGPFAAYAGQLLGISDAKSKATVKWSIEDVSLETFSEPDPNQIYKAMGAGAFLVSLTPAGCLAGINTSVDPTFQNQLKTNSYVEMPEMDDGFSFDNINDLPLYAPGDSTNNFRPMRVSDDKKAAEAAKRVLEVRRIQHDMVAGMMDEFHPDGIAYDVSLKELKQIEDDYTSLFTGRTTYESQLFSFDYVPVSAGGKGEVVFRFSEESGVVAVSDLSGKPVTLKVDLVEALNQKYNATVASQNPAAGQSGVYYRMPAMANMELIYELKTIATMRTLLAQFGVVAPLPEDVLTGEYEVKFHPETGAVKSVMRK
ncbi:MAG TPA: DUF4831 family protein, partial [Prolixibacteraceae bacterium]|nr:DUF4831 family protein [Prolixibacteraceae bacterium]